MIQSMQRLPWVLKVSGGQNNPVKLWVGTSGYSYKAWLGNFYPSVSRQRRCCGFTPRVWLPSRSTTLFIGCPKKACFNLGRNRCRRSLALSLRRRSEYPSKTAQRRRKRSRVSISRGNCTGLAYRRRSFSTPALSPQEFADTAKFLGDFAGGPSGGF